MTLSPQVLGQNKMHVFEIMPLIQTIGLFGVMVFIFAESGLFFGFFLPGDSLLFTAGVLAGAGYFSIAALFIGSFVMAVLGDTFGYYFGKKIGPKIFSKENSLLWNKKHIEKTKNFFSKHGNKAVTLARFVPIVRTFTPILAGVGNMKYGTFILWNILGGLLWTATMIFSGYFLGSRFNNIDSYILPIILIIILVSLIPVLVEFFKKSEK